MRYLSLCSGIEAATVAWHPIGWEPAAFAEIESFPAAVLKHHYPNTPNLGDMTKWREWNVGAIDLLVGGTPCQSFSVAGLRKGLSDPRGGLMLTFLEIAQSLRPRWVVWENVPGVLSSGGGRDFGSFLGALGELGYGWAYRVLDAQWCRVDGYERAVPQRRRRVFVVGCLGDATRAAQVLFEQQSVKRNPAPRRAKGQGVAADAEGGARSGGCYWDGSDCAATLTKQNASGAQRMPDKANFGAVLQPICIDRSAYNQGQNAKWDCPIEQSEVMFGLIARGPHAVAVPYRKSHRASSATDDESWVRAETANTLNSFDTGERDTHAICHLCNHSHDADRVCQECGNDLVCDTLDLCSDCLQEQAEKQSLPHAIATIDMQAGKGNANIGDGSVSPTLCNGSDVHAIALTPGNLSRGAGPSPNSEVAPTQKCSAGRGADDQRTCVAFTCKDHGADAGEVAPTLRAMPHDGSHANGGGQVVIAFNWQNGGGYGNANEGLGITIDGTGPLQRCNTPAVAFKPSHFTRGKDGSPADITPPLSADADKGDQDTVVAYQINGMCLNKELRDKQMTGIGEASDPMYTVRADGTQHAVGFSHSASSTSHGVAFMVEGSPPIRGGGAGNSMPAVATQMVVRRLTPVECERLQGFPDNYTNIPWRGKPESPDGPRYKALGNSMAVNCMRWIGRRIEAVEKGTELPA